MYYVIFDGKEIGKGRINYYGVDQPLSHAHGTLTYKAVSMIKFEERNRTDDFSNLLSSTNIKFM